MIDIVISEVKRETPDIFEGCQVRLPRVSNILLETGKNLEASQTKGERRVSGKMYIKGDYKRELIKVTVVF